LYCNTKGVTAHQRLAMKHAVNPDTASVDDDTGSSKGKVMWELDSSEVL
jgi:hypothetical protein